MAKINGARVGSARKQWQGGLVLIPLESGQMFLGKQKNLVVLNEKENMQNSSTLTCSPISSRVLLIGVSPPSSMSWSSVRTKTMFGFATSAAPRRGKNSIIISELLVGLMTVLESRRENFLSHVKDNTRCCCRQLIEETASRCQSCRRRPARCGTSTWLPARTLQPVGH